MKKLIPWIIIGLVIRLVLMATTLHPDIRGHNLAAYLISQKGELFTFYDHIHQLDRADPIVRVYGDGLFIYPPLAYWTHALFMFILGPLYPWVTFDRLILDMGSLKQFSQGLPLLLILLKLPYLVADLVGLWLIAKYWPGERKLAAAVLWIFNPVIIYTSYMLGQFDIFIAVLLLAAAILAVNKKTTWAAVMIGLAAGFKPFPLLLAPFLGQGWKEKVKLTGLALVTYAVPLIPYLGSVAFKHYALLASQSDKLWYAKVMVSGGQYLPLFVVGLVILLWWNYFSPKALPVWGWFMAVLLLFYSVTHYHPQWFVWITPILIMAATFSRRLWLPMGILFGCYLLIVLSFEPSLNLGLVGLSGSLGWVLTDSVVSLIRGVFAATALVTVAYAAK